MVQDLKRKHIWIAAGGTGGHISPGYALAAALIQDGIHVTFITLVKNLTYPDIGTMQSLSSIDVLAVDAPSMPNRPWHIFSFISKHFVSQKALRKHYLATQPDFIIGMGGFPSFPALWFAKKKGIPFAMSEQNAYPGMVTRLLAKYASKIYLAFPIESTGGMRQYSSKCVHAGNPLRPIFQDQNLPDSLRNKKSHWPPQKILFIGGSQGSLHLNDLYLQLIKKDRFQNIEVTISTGKPHFEKVKNLARKNDRIFPFIQNMGTELLQADLIVARSGSGTLFEIAWSGRPAVLVPFPFATNDHQKANAEALAQNGGAQLIDIRPFNAAEAAESLQRIVENEASFDSFLKSEFSRGNQTFRATLPLNATDIIIKDIYSSFM